MLVSSFSSAPFDHPTMTFLTATRLTIQPLITCCQSVIHPHRHTATPNTTHIPILLPCQPIPLPHPNTITIVPVLVQRYHFAWCSVLFFFYGIFECFCTLFTHYLLLPNGIEHCYTKNTDSPLTTGAPQSYSTTDTKVVNFISTDWASPFNYRPNPHFSPSLECKPTHNQQELPK